MACVPDTYCGEQVFACLVEGCTRMHCSATERTEHMVDHHKWPRSAALAHAKGKDGCGLFCGRRRGERMDPRGLEDEMSKMDIVAEKKA